MDGPRKIAMWSGPRNLSTALMYSFAARGDAAVWDEPFYAAYLHLTGLEHPMRQEVLDAGILDTHLVAAKCRGPIPKARPISYQKHMCQHMIDNIPRDWMRDVTNVFLIRHPARVMASFAAKYEAATLQDIGFLQQAELFDRVSDQTGETPIVIDSADIRRDPDGMLRALCDALSIPFKTEMLAWDVGSKSYDGAWAPHWYAAVHESTGFAGPERSWPELSGEYATIADAALPAYEKLVKHKLTTETR